MAARSRPVERAALRMLTAADAALNRLYGWKGNPLYQSGTLVIALLLSLVATGVWLILFYRVGDPYASVERITSNMWIGNWVRGFHRYASDAAVAAIEAICRPIIEGKPMVPTGEATLQRRVSVP